MRWEGSEGPPVVAQNEPFRFANFTSVSCAKEFVRSRRVLLGLSLFYRHSREQWFRSLPEVCVL
jgi:hypothetical protein